MKRADYRERKGGFQIDRGKYVRLIRGLKTPAAGNVLMTGQFLVKIPSGISQVECRFVRVYEDGKRDGTGDQDLCVMHKSNGQAFQWTWSHPVKSGPFVVDVELRVPGKGKADVQYAMGKTHY